MAMMMHKLKHNKITIGVCIIIVLFAGVLYWILSSQDQEDSEQKKNDNLVEFEGSTLEEKKDGKLIWSLTADKIQVDPDTKIIYVTHPHIIIADVDGEEIKIGILMVHAQDHLMCSILARELVEELIKIYKKI